MSRLGKKLKSSTQDSCLDTIVGRWQIMRLVYIPPGLMDHFDPAWLVGDPSWPSSTGRDASGAVSQEGEKEKEEEEEEEEEMVELGGPGIQIVQFIMDDQYDVTWIVPKGVEPLSIFQTTSFAISKDGDTVELMGGDDGRTFTFDVSHEEEDVLLLGANIEGGMVIKVKKVKVEGEAFSDAFSLLPALDNGFFSDMTIRSADGQPFALHRTVLGSRLSGVKYRDWEVMLSGLKTPILRAAVYYIYTNTLPPDLKLVHGEELLAVMESQPRMEKLAAVLRVFVESHNLKIKLIQLIDELQAGLETGKKIVEAVDMSNPAKVAYAVKQLVREAATVVAKFFVLCELFTRNKKELKKRERQEVLEYFRARFVVYVDLGRELLEQALEKWGQLTEDEEMEMAQYIIPEVTQVWDALLLVTGDIQSKLASKKSVLSQKSFRHFKRHEIKAAIALQFMSRGKELRRLEKISKEFNEMALLAAKKREEFEEESEVERGRRILRAITSLCKEGESQLANLEEFKREILLANALEWKKFKLFVGIICSYVSWGRQKGYSLKEPLKPLLLKACHFVQRSEVNEALVTFGLLDDADVAALGLEGEGEEEEEVGGGARGGAQQTPHCLPALSVSPNENLLALGCLKLLGSQEYSDMKFILHTHSPPSTSSPSTQSEEGEGEVVVIPAHRVIVAARCEWFQRALQSGMQEDINRQVEVYDVDEAVFRRFLNFLYGGVLDTAAMATEELVELLAVADRYETPSLHLLCESVLIQRVGDSSVFMLLEVADRFSVRQLREESFQHIIANPDLLVREVVSFYALSQELQQEVRTVLSATTDPQLALRHQLPKKKAETAASTQPRIRDVESSEEEDEYGLDQDTMAFQTALEELKMLCGEDTSDDVLRDLLLAADCDVNRAANYFFEQT